MEGTKGATTVLNIIEYPKSLKWVTKVIYPDKKDLDKAIQLMRKLLQIGKPVSAIDVIIGSICINREFELLTKDKDFVHIKKVEPRFKLRLKT